MGFKPMRYEDIKEDILKKLKFLREFLEADDGIADPRAKPIIRPETTQEAWDKLLGDVDGKTFSGSLKDIRERLMIK